jgi:hypothetical protein
MIGTITAPTASVLRTDASPKLAYRVDQKKGEVPGAGHSIKG